MTPTRDIAGLLAIMRALRDPQTGCAWDQAQTFATIAPYTVEEAHEVADAIAHGDMPGLKDELGDLLLQVVFHAEIASEQNLFDFGDVVLAITSKLVRRHPHIFGDRRDLSPEDIREAWQRIKREERAETNRAASILDDVPGSLPALAGAQKIQNRAATVGFDWNDPNMVLEKIGEETAEVRQAFDQNDPQAIREEIGDLLFSVVNLARHAGMDAEQTLREATAKFERRFRAIESALSAEGRRAEETSLEELERLWQAAKADGGLRPGSPTPTESAT